MLAYEIEEDQTIDAKYFSGELDARIFSKTSISMIYILLLYQPIMIPIQIF